jgi:hypothetical protein
MFKQLTLLRGVLHIIINTSRNTRTFIHFVTLNLIHLCLEIFIGIAHNKIYLGTVQTCSDVIANIFAVLQKLDRN